MSNSFCWCVSFSTCAISQILSQVLNIASLSSKSILNCFKCKDSVGFQSLFCPRLTLLDVMKSRFSRSTAIFPIANTNQLLFSIEELIIVYWKWFSQLIIWSDEFLARPFHVYDELQLGIVLTQHTFADGSNFFFLNISSHWFTSKD